MKWETVKLAECCISIADGDHQPPPKADTGVPFVTISNINASHQFDFSNTMFVPQEYYDRLDTKRRAQVGDVLYSVVGSFGIPVLITDNAPFVFQRHIAILRPNERILPAFLFYTMLSSDFYSKADAAAIGAAQRTISLNALRNMEIDLPPLEIQEEIVRKLSAYDNLINNNQKQINLLEEAAQRLYKEWFIDLRFPGHETTPIHDGIPEGWERMRLSEIAEVVMGQSPKSEFYNTKREGLPFHQGVGSYGNRFVIDDVYSTSFTRIAKAGSVLFSVRAPVGRLNITRNKVVIGRGLAAMNHKAGLQSFLFYMLKERFFKDNLVGNGAIFASISKNELLEQLFVVPTERIASQYNGIASSIDEKIEILDREIMILSEARDRLLPKLMGEEY